MTFLYPRKWFERLYLSEEMRKKRWNIAYLKNLPEKFCVSKISSNFAAKKSNRCKKKEILKLK